MRQLQRPEIWIAEMPRLRSKFLERESPQRTSEILFDRNGNASALPFRDINVSYFVLFVSYLSNELDLVLDANGAQIDQSVEVHVIPFPFKCETLRVIQRVLECSIGRKRGVGLSFELP